MSIVLVAKKRTEDVDVVRSEGMVPAVVYGKGMKTTSLSIPMTAFQKLYEQAGDSSLVDLQIEGGETLPVVVQDVQMNPVKRDVMHVDFKRVIMGEVMTVDVALEFVGVPPAEKGLGGTTIKSIDSITVSCLPKDLADRIVVDLSSLQTFDDSISVSDIVLPEGMTLVTSATALVAKVAAPITEDKLKAMEEEGVGNIEDIAVEEKGKKEESKEEEKA